MFYILRVTHSFVLDQQNENKWMNEWTKDKNEWSYNTATPTYLYVTDRENFTSAHEVFCNWGTESP
jgi:hypothetical protein